MTCARGCCDTQWEHYRSLHVSNPNAPTSKTTKDVHESGGRVTHTVDVTESGDRQDVTVKLNAPVTKSA